MASATSRDPPSASRAGPPPGRSSSSRRSSRSGSPRRLTALFTHRRQAGVPPARRRRARRIARQRARPRRRHQDLDRASALRLVGGPDGRRWTPASTKPAGDCSNHHMDALLQDIRYAIRLCLRTPGLHRGRGARAGARHRRQHGNFHHRQRGAARAAAVSRSGAPGRAVGDQRAPARARRTSSGRRISARWQERATAFERMAPFYDYRVNLTGGGEPEELIAQDVTPDFFPTLGVSPLVGRTFAPDEGPDGRNARRGPRLRPLAAALRRRPGDRRTHDSTRAASRSRSSA